MMNNKWFRKNTSRVLAMILAASMVISLGADVTSTTNVYAAESQVVSKETSTQATGEGEGDDKSVADDNTGSGSTITEDGSASDSNTGDNSSSCDSNNNEAGNAGDTSDKKSTDTDSSDDNSSSDDSTAADDKKDNASDADTSNKENAAADDTTKDTDKKNSDNATTESTETDEDAEDEETEVEQSDTSSCLVLSVSEAPRKLRGVLRSYGINLTSDGDETVEPTDFGQYITSGTFNKGVNGKWVESSDFTDGDSVQIVLNFSIPANTVTKNNTAITYQLPKGIKLAKEETGTAKWRDEDGNQISVGTYTITTDGKITINYYDSFADSKAFTGSITFEGTLDRSETGDDGEVKFDGDGGTITIQEQPQQYDISTSKTGSYDGSKINYKITTSTTKGTSGEVNIQDWFKGGEDNATYDWDSIKITYVKDGDTTGTDVTDTYKDKIVFSEEGGKHFTITGLPQLNAGEKYLVEYTATPGTTTNTDGSQKVGNWATSTSGNNNSNDGSEVVIHESKLEKSGQYDSVNNRITWTITVNKGHEMMNNYQITDELPEGCTLIGSVEVSKVDKDGTTATNSWHKVDTMSTDSKLVYQFSGDSTYTLKFQTTAPAGTSSGKAVSNTVKDGDGKEATGTTTVTSRDWNVSKSKQWATNGTISTPPTVTWSSYITVPTGEQTEIIWEDEIHEAQDKDGNTIEGATDTHYITWSQLNDLQVSYDMRDSASSSDINYQITAYKEKDGEEVTSGSSDKIKYWKVTFTIPEAVKDKVAGINLKYNTTVNYDSIPSDTTWYYRNTAIIPDHTATATHEHKQEPAIRKSSGTNLGGMNFGTRNRDGSVQGYGSADFKSGSSSLTLGSDGTFWYRVVVSTTAANDKDIVVTDQLPEGVSIVGLSSYLTEGKFNSTAFTDSNYTYSEDCPVRIYMNTDRGYGFSDYYRVERCAKVSYDTDSNELKIEIPYEDTTKDGYDETHANYQHWNNWSATTSEEPKCPFFEILYKVTVSEDSSIWKDMGDSFQHTFTNHVAWGTDTDETTTTVDKAKERVIKSATQEKDENGDWKSTVEYSVIINPLEEDLNANSDFLRLTDTLTLPSDGSVTARFILESVALYPYDKSAENHRGTTALASNMFRISEYNEDGHTFTATVPDNMACVLVYKYEFKSTSQKDVSTVSNKVTLGGKWSNTYPMDVHKQTSSSDVKYNVVYIYKVDSGDYSTRLKDVEFSLQYWVKPEGDKEGYWYTVSGGRGEGGTYVTDENGKLTLSTNSGNDGTTQAKLQQNVLYRLQELKNPNAGYVVDNTPMYFMLLNSAGDKANQFSKLGSVTDTVDDVEKTLTSDDVNGYGVGSDGYATIYFENENTELTVTKVWQDKDGKELSVEEANKQNAVTVQLMQNTITPGTKGWNVYLTLTGPYDTPNTQNLFVAYDSQIVVTSHSDNYNKSDYTVPSGWTTDWTAADSGGWTVTMTSPEITSDIADGEWSVSRSWGWSGTWPVTSTYPDDDFVSAPYEGEQGGTRTLSAENNWTASWKNLLKTGPNGETYTYSIKEVTTGAFTTTIPTNEASSGTITVYNKLKEMYELPKTGGGGSLPFTLGGCGFILAGMFYCSYSRRRRKGGRF